MGCMPLNLTAEHKINTHGVSSPSACMLYHYIGPYEISAGREALIKALYVIKPYSFDLSFHI